ncbi:MAG: hypothetical protein SFZ02_12270 [bacterium]|nr:hypothetical protein [bacterium]
MGNNEQIPYTLVQEDGRWVLYIINPREPAIMHAYSSAKHFNCASEADWLTDSRGIEVTKDELIALAEAKDNPTPTLPI